MDSAEGLRAILTDASPQCVRNTQPAAEKVCDLVRRLGDIEKRLDAEQQAIDQLTKSGVGKRTVPRD
jgi:hypothetical protein